MLVRPEEIHEERKNEDPIIDEIDPTSDQLIAEEAKRGP